jgi:putative transposase
LLRVIAIKRFISRYPQQIKDNVLQIHRVILDNVHKVSRSMGLKAVLKYLDRPYSWYVNIRTNRGCNLSLLNLCRIKHPSQLLKKESDAITNYCNDGRYIHWPLSSVYHQMRKDKTLACHLSTFYKYVSLLHLKRAIPGSRRKSHDIGIRASRVLEILHADVTLFRTADHKKSYIYLVQDNYSRAILAWEVSEQCRAEITLKNLKEVRQKYLEPSGVRDCRLITDDGSENAGQVKEWLNGLSDPPIEHLIAQRDIVQSNSMIEAVNKQIKYRFLYHKTIGDFECLVGYVKEAVEDYNSRPSQALEGLTPNEVLEGKVFNNAVDYQEIIAAQVRRAEENKKARCCHYSF